jgi:hypothetical protein
MVKRIVIVALSVAALSGTTVAAAQEPGPRSFGIRGGFRIGEGDFDQVVLGAHADMGDVATDLRVAPNLQLGIGSDVMIVSINPELHYVFRDEPIDAETFFYAGGGLGLNIQSYDDEVAAPGDGDPGGTDTELKVNVVAGVEKRTCATMGVFGEFRVSFVDGTWFDFLAGLNFLR